MDQLRDSTAKSAVALLLMHISRRAALATPMVAGAAIAAPVMGGAFTAPANAAPGEVWPAIPFRPEFRELVHRGVTTYRRDDHKRFFVEDYTSTGRYFNYGHVIWSDNVTAYRFDSDGVPQSLYHGEYWDHPVTLCRFALHLHDRITHYGETEKTDRFFRVVDRILAAQTSDGIFRYPFPYKVYGYNFAPGWPSGMAQGMALSVLRRADALRPDKRFTTAGNRAVVFLTRMVEKGGVRRSLAGLDPSLTDHVWLEEFPTQPANYKLNGFLFTLIGLYDWWQRAPHLTSGSKTVTAGELFHKGAATAAATLAYFDLRGFTALDLRYVANPKLTPVIDIGYHRVHIYQCHLLAQITTGEVSTTYKSYEKLWRWYVGDVS